MKHVSATEAKQRFAAIIDAAQQEPVAIRRQNREVAVILSAREYDRLRGLNVQEFESFCDNIAERARERGLSNAALQDLLVKDQD
ncbi:MAG: type II toxin-antitoxin system Phd/YefM family antitoxin [Wenzhouxiangella sp.]